MKHTYSVTKKHSGARDVRCNACHRRFTQIFFTACRINKSGRGAWKARQELENGMDIFELAQRLNDGQGL